MFSHSCTVIHTNGKCILHSQKCHRLAPSCGFYQLAASLSRGCSKSLNFIKFHAASLLRFVTWCAQTCCKFMKRLATITWIFNFQQSSLLTTYYHQARASNSNTWNIGVMAVRQQACSRLAATCVFLAVYIHVYISKPNQWVD